MSHDINERFFQWIFEIAYEELYNLFDREPTDQELEDHAQVLIGKCGY